MTAEQPNGSSKFTGIKRFAWVSWLVLLYGADRIIDLSHDHALRIRREWELFLGVLLVLVGLLNFENGKNCDGNTADYLSCTRPSTYYYFNGFEIAAIIIGVFLVTLWVLRTFRSN